MAAAILLSKLFKLNLPIVIVAANISLPPNIPWILFLSLWFGALVLGLDEIIPWSSEFTLELAKHHLKQYIIGSVIFALIASVLLGNVSYLFFRLSGRKR